MADQREEKKRCGMDVHESTIPQILHPKTHQVGVDTDGEETGYVPHNGFVKVLREKII